MALTNTTVTLSQDELFEAFRREVDPAHYDVLRKELNRRWPEGFRLQVHLAISPAEESAQPENNQR